MAVDWFEAAWGDPDGWGEAVWEKTDVAAKRRTRETERDASNILFIFIDASSVIFYYLLTTKGFL